MSSLLVPSSSACCSRPCPSPLPLSSRSPSLSAFVSFPLQTRSRCRLRVRASRASESEGFASAGDSKAPNGTLPKSRRGILLEYVRNVQPEFMELFIKRAPQQVVDAMRQTVTNTIGTLPPQFFAVTVTTVAENLAQLMYSVLMTGYMFKNAQYRLELQQSLEQVALPDAHDKKALLPPYSRPQQVVLPCTKCGNLFLGDLASEGCKRSTCAYQGYTNATGLSILSDLVPQSTCNNNRAPTPQPAGGNSPPGAESPPRPSSAGRLRLQGHHQIELLVLVQVALFWFCFWA